MDERRHLGPSGAPWFLVRVNTMSSAELHLMLRTSSLTGAPGKIEHGVRWVLMRVAAKL